MAYGALPEGYVEKREINLKDDKKLTIWVNVWALIIGVLLFALGFWIHPIRFSDNGSGELLMKLIVMAIGFIVCIVLQEAIHALLFRIYSKEKLNFGFTGFFIYVGCIAAYFKKASYIIISLAPVCLLAAVLVVLLVILPKEWFWVAYAVQVINISAAVGLIYTSYLTIRGPKGMLVNDCGLYIRFYEKEGDRV